MITNSYNIEFGYELIAVIPWAYWLHEHNQLSRTISGKDTKCLYYFSSDHTEVDGRRHWDNMTSAINIPNIHIHRTILDKTKWLPPPYKQIYQNDEFKFDKPTLVVTNKYNQEWSHDPINFFDHNTLRWIFDKYQDDYQVVYIRFISEMGYDDTVDTWDLKDFETVLPDYPKVKTIQGLHDLYPYSYNELQLRIFANCEKYITVQGGLAVLASYFGGENIIYARVAPEFDSGAILWYDGFGGSRIIPIGSYELLKEYCDTIK